LWRRYSFPGNVRELKNIVARLQVKYAGQSVDKDKLALEMSDKDIAADKAENTHRLVEYGYDNGDGTPHTPHLVKIASRLGQHYARTVLMTNHHDATKTAQQLNIGEDDLRQLTELDSL